MTRRAIIIDACKEVGPPLFFSLLIIAVSFLPVFTLEAQEGRLFAPLAYTKTFAMLGGALLSVTLLPMLMVYMIRGRILPEAKNPLNRWLIAAYRPIIRWVVRYALADGHRGGAGAAGHLVADDAPRHRVHADAERGHDLLHADVAARHVGDQGHRAGADCRTNHQELPGSRIGDRQGRPRGHRHRPGAGRDVRDRDQPQAGGQWRARHDDDKLIARNGQGAAVAGHRELLDDADPGAHRHVVDRDPHADRRQGVRLEPRTRWSALAREIEDRGENVPGTTSALAERLTGGYYLNIEPDREASRGFGIRVNVVQDVIATALGGEVLTTTVEGRDALE